MCNGPLLGKLLIFALPLMLSGILQLLFNAADIIVVGRFTGSHALAAVGSTSSLINLLVNLFIGFSIGANVLTAQYYGAKDQKKYSSDHTYLHFDQSDWRNHFDCCRRTACPTAAGTHGYTGRRARSGYTLYENLFLWNAGDYGL